MCGVREATTAHPKYTHWLNGWNIASATHEHSPLIHSHQLIVSNCFHWFLVDCKWTAVLFRVMVKCQPPYRCTVCTHSYPTYMPFVDSALLLVANVWCLSSIVCATWESSEVLLLSRRYWALSPHMRRMLPQYIYTAQSDDWKFESHSDRRTMLLLWTRDGDYSIEKLLLQYMMLADIIQNGISIWHDRLSRQRQRTHRQLILSFFFR